MSDPSKADSDLKMLAPRFEAAVEAAIKECGETKEPHGTGKLEVKVFEALRSEERQAWLYAQGRTRPGNKVTNAKSARTSWHGYGLAVDVVHRTKFWSPYGHHLFFRECSLKLAKPAEICHKLDLGHRQGSPLFATNRDQLGAKVGAR